MSNIKIEQLLPSCRTITKEEEILIICPNKKIFFQICKQQKSIIKMLLQKYPGSTQFTITADNPSYRVSLPSIITSVHRH